MLVSDSSFLLCLFTIFLMKCYTDDLFCTTCGDCEHRSNSLCVFLRLAMFSLCICYSSHFSNSRNLIGCSFPLGTLQYVHCISYSIFGMFFRSKVTILSIFIIWFIRQDGLIWVSSWHLFFLREFVCVCACVHACVLDILSSYCWELVFLLLLLLGWFCLPSKFSGQKQWRPSKFPLPCNIFNKYLKVVVSFCWIILDYLLR